MLPGSVHDLFFGWRNWFGKSYSQIWNMVLPAFSGLCGENGIIVPLRMRSARGLNFMNYSLILCMIGLQFRDFPTPNLSFLF